MTYDGVYRYYYDCENRLTDINDVEGTRIVSYKYDYSGKRVAKVDYSLSPTRWTLFCYDGDQIIADYNEAGTLQRRYVYGPGIDEPLCMLDSAGNHWYFFDGLGSVTALARTNQTPEEKYTYDVFGKPTIKGPSDEPRVMSDVNNRYMFTAREFEPETGLYYYRARFYRPSIGKFLQTDPIGYESGLNLYTYVKNNPISKKDPLGLWTMEECNANLERARRHLTESTQDCVISWGREELRSIAICMTACLIAHFGGGPAVGGICDILCVAGSMGLDNWVLHRCVRSVDRDYANALRAFNYCSCRARGCSASICASGSL